MPIFNQVTTSRMSYFDLAKKLEAQKELVTDTKEPGMETPFIISTSSCGSAATRIVTARSAIDVKRALLATEWKPNTDYFYQQLGLTEEERVLAVFIGLQSDKKFWELKPEDMGSLEALRGNSDRELLAILRDQDIEQLFEFAFVGGEGEQEGVPGHEWTTITVQPLVVLTFPSIYKEFDVSKETTEGQRQTCLESAGLWLPGGDTASKATVVSSPVQPERQYVEQDALVAYAKIFGKVLTGDFEGALAVQVRSGVLKIFPSGQVATLIPNDPKENPVFYPSGFFDRLRAELKLDNSPAKPPADVILEPTGLSRAEIQEAAEGLVKKHKAYLAMVFLGYPKTMIEALFQEEAGWTSILTSCDELQNKKGREFSPESCKALFAEAIRVGFLRHMETCSRMPTISCKPLCCQQRGSCAVSIHDYYLERLNYELTENEAKVLSDLLKPQDRTTEAYTADAIVKALC